MVVDKNVAEHIELVDKEEAMDKEESNEPIISRKAHLLEDKQIPSVGVFDEVSFYTLFQGFGRHLEEIHVTWTQYGKKQDKIATLHEDDLGTQFVETVSQCLVMTSKCSRDDVRIFYDEVKVADTKKPKEDSTG
nr:hypothetical protein [Tanacetum cinerariifolium]